MRPLRDLVRHTLIYGIGNVGMSLISFVLIPVYTRYLTPGEYGVLALVLLFQALMARFYDLGLQNAVGRFYFDHTGEGAEEGIGRMLFTTQVFLLLYGGLLSLGIVVLATPLSELLLHEAASASLLRIIAATLILEILAMPGLTLLRMEERSVAWVLLSSLRVLLTLVLNIYFVVVAGLGVQGILLGYAISAGVSAVAVLAITVKRWVPRFRWEELKKMLSFGLPFLPVLLGVLVIELSDRYLLEILRSVDEVGVYTLGTKFGQAMLLAVSAFSMGWAPLRYRIYERPDARELYTRIATLFMALALTGVVAISVWGDEIVQIAATPAYFEASRVIPWVTAAYALYGLHIIVVTGMGVTKKTGPMAIVVAVAALANVGANLLLIPRYGMMAAAVTTTGANAVLVVGTLYFSQRVYRIPYEWPRLVAMGAAATVLIVADSRVTGGGLASGAALGLVSLVVFVGMVRLLGGVRGADIQALRQWLGHRRSQGTSP